MLELEALWSDHFCANMSVLSKCQITSKTTNCKISNFRYINSATASVFRCTENKKVRLRCMLSVPLVILMLSVPPITSWRSFIKLLHILDVIETFCCQLSGVA